MPAFLLPLAGYGLASLGVGTGLTAAGIKLGQAIPGLGLDIDSVARGETVDLTEIGEDGSVNKVENYDFFDRFRDGVLGYSEADVAKKRGEQRKKSIQKVNAPETLEISTYRQGLNLDPAGIQTMRPGETADMYKSRINRETAIVNEAQKYENNPNPNKAPLVSLGGKPSLAQLRTANTAATNTDPYGARQTGIYNRTQAENARLEETRRYNTERLDLLEQQLRQDRNRSEDRKSEFQLNQMQYDLQNRRLDMQEARNFRNDRQKAIMQIVQGMRSMGNSFMY
tara:strand:- start:887 stop:1735 length:849 start_codon:yes stop_codon:yes gene_type:complete